MAKLKWWEILLAFFLLTYAILVLTNIEWVGAKYTVGALAALTSVAMLFKNA